MNAIDASYMIMELRKTRDDIDREIVATENILDPLKRRRQNISDEILEIQRTQYTTYQILGPGRFVANFTTEGLYNQANEESFDCMVYVNDYYIMVEEDRYSLKIGTYQIYDSECLRELEAILADYVIDNGVAWIEHN